MGTVVVPLPPGGVFSQAPGEPLINCTVQPNSFVLANGIGIKAGQNFTVPLRAGLGLVASQLAKQNPVGGFGGFGDRIDIGRPGRPDFGRPGRPPFGDRDRGDRDRGDRDRRDRDRDRGRIEAGDRHRRDRDRDRDRDEERRHRDREHEGRRHRDR